MATPTRKRSKSRTHKPERTAHRDAASRPAANGRRTAAAAELGISRSTLWRKLYAHRLR